MRTLQNRNPTPEQLKILTDAGPGFRLIRGAAGSGKTTSALLRLRQLCRSRVERNRRLNHDEPVRVLVLTFNRTLRGYVKQLASEQVETSDNLHLEVETFGRWARNLVGQQQEVIEGSRARECIDGLLRGVGVDAAHIDYFVDEIEYIRGRFLPAKRQEYIQASRSGRGRAPAIPREMRVRLLDDVIKPYELRKSERSIVDWNDIALQAATTPSQGYDVVVVDESQDLSANQIRAVLAHLRKDYVTTFIIDAVQRIYPQSFRWREVDIEMRPEMVFALTHNYRNTVEIAQFASSLVQDLPPEEDGVIPDARACQRTGPRPKLVAGAYRAQLDYMLDCIQPFLDSGEEVAILHPKGGRWFDFTRQRLRERHICYCELTRESDWPTGPEQVALATIHSAKGLEFDHVLLPGLNQEVTPHGREKGDGTLDSLRRLVAMGICRAHKSVMLGYKPGEQSTLIGLIGPATYDLIEV